MRALLAGLLAVAVGVPAILSQACFIPTLSVSPKDAGASPSSTASADAAAAGVQGASCTTVATGVSLCQYISSCPSLVLNAKVFPQCGFRIHGDAIDPECVCGTSLCPIGVPTTCTEAAQMASGDVTYDSVCQQANVGGCTSLTGSGTSSGGGTTTSACQTCIANCANVPSCIDACAC